MYVSIVISLYSRNATVTKPHKFGFSDTARAFGKMAFTHLSS